MIEHLEWHQHAFIDENNDVINVAVFDEWAHNHQLLEDVKISIGASEVICCCQYGIAGIGDKWDETNNCWITPIVVVPLEDIAEEFQV